MTKRDIITYVIGGVLFLIFYVFVMLLLLGFFVSSGGNKFVKLTGDVLFLIYSPANIKTNSCMGLVSVCTYLFLLGGLLSLLISYGFYKLEAKRSKEFVNPISNKSIFIAIAAFIGFAWLVRMITMPGVY